GLGGDDWCASERD
ncbi:MAG: hypothetical protein EZS28_047775, partial [Streblomastix strix]